MQKCKQKTLRVCFEAYIPYGSPASFWKYLTDGSLFVAFVAVALDGNEHTHHLRLVPWQNHRYIDGIGGLVRTVYSFYSCLHPTKVNDRVSRDCNASV